MTLKFADINHALRVRVICELAYLVNVGQFSARTANKCYALIEHYIDNLTPRELHELGRGYFSIVVAIFRKSERAKLIYSNTTTNTLLISWTNRFYRSDNLLPGNSPIDDIMVQAFRYSDAVVYRTNQLF